MMNNSSMTMASSIASLSTQAILRVSSTDSQRYAEHLLPLDILCGNEKCFEHHPGNMRYQQILSKMRPAFASVESKAAKKKMVRDVDEFIQSYGGRFLRLDESTRRLRVMTTAESRNKISRSLRENPSPQKNLKICTAKITELDVMCGRGGKANHHLGNKLYRKLVSAMKEKYRNTEGKDEKTELSRSIVEQVCDYGGRFVKKDSGSGRYYVLTKDEARTKTSQALRENRDPKASSSDDSDSDCDVPNNLKAPPTREEPAAINERGAKKALGLDNDSLDCCRALVSLSRAGSPPLHSKAA